MAGPAPYLSRFAAVATLFVGFGVARPARAEVHVSIQVDSEERVELAERLASELGSEGYATEITRGAEVSPCEANGGRLGTVSRDTKAWVRLAASPEDGEKIVASICYLGALPFLQQASSSAPRSEPRQLAVETTEALNGLRSKLPPIVGESPARIAPRDTAPAVGVNVDSAGGSANSAVLGLAVLRNLPDHPAMLGATLRTTLGIGSRAGLTLDAFVPVTGSELESSLVTATLRVAWLRLGPRLGFEPGGFYVSGALLAGPAISWAEAVARAPRIGTADVSVGALLSAAVLVEYPRRAPVFACASASASALLPGSRVDLGDPAPPRGSWPIEASLGLGARWGAAR
jgi:hypothetical protein